MKHDDIKEQRIVAMVPVIQSPELIKVKTISPKVVDQLPWLGNNWQDQEIVGHLPQAGAMVLRHKRTGHLSRASDLNYIEARAKEGIELDVPRQEAIDQANREIAALPQLFTV